MSSQPDKAGQPGATPEPYTETDSRNSVYLYFDGVGDTTIRPIDSPILKQIRPDQPPEGPKPEAK